MDTPTPAPSPAAQQPQPAPNPAPNPAPEAAKSPPAPVKTDPAAIIDRWVSERLRGGPIARNTECWNVLAHALEDLKARLTQE